MANNKNRVGLSNIISLAGLALLGFFTFMGALMLTSGNMGASIGIGVGAVIVMSLLLGATVYCKRVDSDFKRWRKVEIAALLLFVIASVFPSRYVMQFFEVIGNKEELQKAAHNDADNLRNMFSLYEDAEQKALAVTATGLQNAYGEDCDINVREYFSSAAINNYEDIDTWILNERRMLLGNAGADGTVVYQSYKQNADSIISNWESDVNMWNLMKIGLKSKLPNELAPTIVEDLSKLSQSGKLPVIIYTDGMYQMSKSNQTVSITEPEFEFKQKVTTAGDLNILYLLIYIIIVALIAVHYVMTPRSEKTEIGNGQSIIDYDGVNRL